MRIIFCHTGNAGIIRGFSHSRDCLELVLEKTNPALNTPKIVYCYFDFDVKNDQAYINNLDIALELDCNNQFIEDPNSLIENVKEPLWQSYDEWPLYIEKTYGYKDKPYFTIYG